MKVNTKDKSTSWMRIGIGRESAYSVHQHRMIDTKHLHLPKDHTSKFASNLKEVVTNDISKDENML